MKRLKMLYKTLLSYFPSNLPTGLTEYEKWVDSIIELSGPFADRDSMIYAVSSQLIHLPHTKSSVPKQFFVRSLRKAAANQVASQVFQDIKLRQQAKAEDTAKLEGSNEELKTQTKDA